MSEARGDKRLTDACGGDRADVRAGAGEPVREAREVPRPTDARRVLLTLSYDGTAYAGWQRQQNALSVQEVVERALERLTGAPVGLTGASRTDAGVHALGQRAHFDTQSRIPPEKYPFALNTMLPRDVRALCGQEVRADFHARFNARGKRYEYRIHNAPHASALLRDQTAHVPVPLDVSLMERALADVLGRHDFAAFQASGGTAKTTVRTVAAATLARAGDELTLSIQGDAFLYNMVRIIAGTLIEIGMGKRPPDAFLQAFATGDRLALGATAPAKGLTLMEVFYAPGDA